MESEGEREKPTEMDIKTVADCSCWKMGSVHSAKVYYERNFYSINRVHTAARTSPERHLVVPTPLEMIRVEKK